MSSKKPTSRPDATLFPAAACQLAQIRDVLKVHGPIVGLVGYWVSQMIVLGYSARTTSLPTVQVFPVPAESEQRLDLPDKETWTGAALSKIEDLHTLGFSQSQGLAAVTATGTLDRDVLIEWLLLHTPQKDIPRVFALQSASESGNVAVLRKADPAARETASTRESVQREAREPVGPTYQEVKEWAVAKTPAPDQKAWILQHLEAAASSSNDGEDSRSQVADWVVAAVGACMLLTTMSGRSIGVGLGKHLGALCSLFRVVLAGFRDRDTPQPRGLWCSCSFLR